MPAKTDRSALRHDRRRLDDIRKKIPPDDWLVRLSQLFAVLTDPTRLKILTGLHQAELCVHEIADIAGPSLSAVSHQLRILKTMRLVKFRKQGQEVYYALADDHIEKLIGLAGEHLDEN